MRSGPPDAERLFRGSTRAVDTSASPEERSCGPPRLTTDQFADPHSDIAGALIRVNVETGSPLASGVGPEGYVFYNYDPVIHATNPDYVAASYPASTSPDFYVSGFADEKESSVARRR